MNKGEIVNALATKTGNTKTETNKFVDAFVATISEVLSKKQEINLIGFGKFYITSSKARKGKNPRTGESINIPASNTPRFKAGKGLKDKVNK